ncbi:MAG: agmatine deiminase family protein [Prevotella sp.]
MEEKRMKRNGRMIAEWERQSAVQLTWPHDLTDWAEMLQEINATYVEMAKAITEREQLIVVTPHVKDVNGLLKLHLSDRQMQQVAYCECDTNDTWARDHGLITLEDAANEHVLLDFKFNGWGEKFEYAKDNAINATLYRTGLIKGRYENHLDFVLEGGAIESDGRGTVFTTTGCLMAPHRNQPLTRDEIEAQLKKRLFADRVMWIDNGSLMGDDTDGHIDTLVRIAPKDTLLYVGCDDLDDVHYEPLKAMEEELKQWRTAEGDAYRLLKLPLPTAIFRNGERLPATYANYLVVNGAVLCPIYGQAEKDRLALQQIRQAYPDREILPIDCKSIIAQHGSLHCCTMQYY